MRSSSPERTPVLYGRPPPRLPTIRRVTLSQWKCRLCGFDRYHRVTVLRKSGARYKTPFYACSRCSVMFLNAAQSDANSTENPNVEAPPAVVTPMRRRR